MTGGLFLLSMVNFYLKKKHLILVLMSLELMMMFLLIQTGEWVKAELVMYMFIIILVIMVCESCLGMSLFVGYSRFYSLDSMLVTSFSKF